MTKCVIEVLYNVYETKEFRPDKHTKRSKRMKNSATSITRIITMIVSAGIIAAAMCFIPIMSVYCSGDSESGTLVVKGINLMEFSAWGIIPLFADLLVPFIVFGRQSDRVKETELILLFIANTVSYVHSFNAARTWLAEVGSSVISHHLGVYIFPLGCLAILLLSKAAGVLYEVIDSTYEDQAQEEP